MYTHRMLTDAASFIGMEVFALIHQYGYSLDGDTDDSEIQTSTDLSNRKFYKIAIKFRLDKTNPPEGSSGTKKPELSQIEDDEERSEERKSIESGRMNPNLVFGGSNDAKVFDLPENDKLYRSKYKHLVKDTRENYYERESLFYFFKNYTISDEERKHLWKIRIGNHLGITRELYDSLSLRLEAEGIKNQYSKLIANDLFRTLPNYGSTKIGESMYQKLHHILSLFQLYRPDIGYVQGMSFLVVMLYFYYDEFETFAIFSNLIITKPLLFACYDFDLPTVNLNNTDGTV